jgi:hypothetical protein
MDTQTQIASQIIDSEANYVLGLKGNQGILEEEVRESFEKIGAAIHANHDKDIVVYTLLFAFLSSNAQNIEFTKADPQPNFYEVYGGSFASGDIDGDGDNDLLIAGQTPSKRTGLYINDGNGNFTELANPSLPQFQNNGVDVADVDVDVADTDNDGDLDILLSGDGDNFMAQTAIYINDGSGQFSELTTTNLQHTSYWRKCLFRFR